MAVQIETARLVLVPLTHDDVAAVLRVRSDPQASQWNLTGLTDTTQKAAHFLSCVVATPGKPARYSYAVYLAGESTRSSCVGLIMLWSETQEQTGTSEYHIAYQFLPEVWGQGIATEAVVGVVEALRGVINPATIVAWVGEENPASRRVLEKAGFGFEEKRVLGEGRVLIGDVWRENAVEVFGMWS